jgi:hypothetical protein
MDLPSLVEREAQRIMPSAAPVVFEVIAVQQDIPDKHNALRKFRGQVRNPLKLQDVPA